MGAFVKLLSSRIWNFVPANACLSFVHEELARWNSGGIDESIVSNVEPRFLRFTCHKEDMRMRVLIAEKDPNGRRLLEQVMRLEGYEVFLAECGKGVKRMVRELKPDIVLLNVFYPLNSGAEALDRIKVRCNWRAEPALLVTCVGKCDELAGQGGTSIFDRLPSNLKIRIVERIQRLCSGFKQIKRRSSGGGGFAVERMFSLNELDAHRLMIAAM